MDSIHSIDNVHNRAVLLTGLTQLPVVSPHLLSCIHFALDCNFESSVCPQFGESGFFGTSGLLPGNNRGEMALVTKPKTASREDIRIGQ